MRQHSLQVLKNPDRVVLDVAGARLAPRRTPGAGRRRHRETGAYLARAHGELRIVLDLSRPIQAKSFLAAPNNRYGYRLVIDLGVGQGVETPVKAEHAPPDARDLIIAIDAGHGGEDPGAIGKNGTREKDVVLAIARRARAQDHGRAGDEGRADPQRRLLRAACATACGAPARRQRTCSSRFMPIRFATGASTAPRCTSCPSAARPTKPRAGWPSAKMPPILIGGVSLDDKDDVLASVLLDLSQSASLSASQVGAERVLRQLNRVGEVRKPQVQQARFMVLKSPDIPSELGDPRADPATGVALTVDVQFELRLRDQAVCDQDVI